MEFAFVFAMWTVMMVGMMTPSELIESLGYKAVTFISAELCSQKQTSVGCSGAIPTTMNKHSTTNMTKLFVCVGRFSGRLAVKYIGDALTLALGSKEGDVLGYPVPHYGYIGALVVPATSIFAAIRRASSGCSNAEMPPIE